MNSLTTLSPPPEARQLLQASLKLHDARPWSDAEAGYRAVLARHPARLDALLGLGQLSSQEKRFAEAASWFQVAVAADPTQASAHLALARALRQLGHDDEATQHFDQAMALRPDEAHYALAARMHRGSVLEAQGRVDEALTCFQDAVQHHPDEADAWAALAMLQWRVQGAESSLDSFRRALQIDSARPELIEKFGLALQAHNSVEDAAIMFQHLLQMEPTRPLTAGRLMHTKMMAADWTALDQLQQRVEAGIRAGQLTAEPFGLQGYCSSPLLLLRAAQAYAAAHLPDRSAQLAPATLSDGSKIRIGYSSGEFRQQATSLLLTEVLEMHDREHFEVYAIDNGWSDGSALRQRIENAVTEVVPIRGLSDKEAAAAIRARGIHILVNLNGYFGLARNGVFSLRPAPIQVNYLGFPGTLGAEFIDYLIADEVVIPPEAHAHYSEKVITLPGSYQPNDSQRPVSSEPLQRRDVGLPDDAFVFCCMNNVYKITPAVFDIWMRLLKQVPGSVLWLYGRVAEARDNLIHEVAERGVAAERLVFAPALPPDRHLARLRLADLFLDTWPYNAHTTGSDALWAGLPVLTCSGSTFPSRVGASLLHAVGLPELVTDSFEAYESLALRLATEPGLLSGLRERLASNLPHAPLYDTPRYVRHLEAAYKRMVERARGGQPPEAFSVSPC
ncbi:MAG: tetratricopeptide repeat protein [Rhizobacter sp.]|nr:tetratricopeptide repeat protein [Rhizobacter sp.]